MLSSIVSSPSPLFPRPDRPPQTFTTLFPRISLKNNPRKILTLQNASRETSTESQRSADPRVSPQISAHFHAQQIKTCRTISSSYRRTTMAGRLAGKVAAITGGNQGIGLGIAQR